MVRISAIFIAVCMVLIAGSVGFVVYLRFGLTGAESFLIGLGVLTALAVYNAVAARGGIVAGKVPVTGIRWTGFMQ